MASLFAYGFCAKHVYDGVCMNCVDEDIESNEKIVSELRKALRFLVDAADTEPSMSIYKAHIEQARKLLNAS